MKIKNTAYKIEDEYDLKLMKLLSMVSGTRKRYK